MLRTNTRPQFRSKVISLILNYTVNYLIAWGYLYFVVVGSSGKNGCKNLKLFCLRVNIHSPNIQLAVLKNSAHDRPI